MREYISKVDELKETVDQKLEEASQDNNKPIVYGSDQQLMIGAPPAMLPGVNPGIIGQTVNNSYNPGYQGYGI